MCHIFANAIVCVWRWSAFGESSNTIYGPNNGKYACRIRFHNNVVCRFSAFYAASLSPHPTSHFVWLWWPIFPVIFMQPNNTLLLSIRITKEWPLNCMDFSSPFHRAIRMALERWKKYASLHCVVRFYDFFFLRFVLRWVPSFIEKHTEDEERRDEKKTETTAATASHQLAN